VSALELLLQDFLLGEHLLLVGNQGVGKNKHADRLLQLLNGPRKYIQLHRLAFREVPVHIFFKILRSDL
jgi:MoxR-like ATPase